MTQASLKDCSATVLAARGRPALHPRWRQTCFPRPQTCSRQQYSAPHPRNAGWVYRPEPVRRYAVAGSKHLLTNRKYRASGRSCWKWRCSLTSSSTRSCPGQPMQSCRVRPRHAKTASRLPNRPARCCLRFPGRLSHSQWDKALPWSPVDDAVSPDSSKASQRTKALQLPEDFPRRKAHDAPCVHAEIQVAGRLFEVSFHLCQDVGSP